MSGSRAVTFWVILGICVLLIAGCEHSLNALRHKPLEAGFAAVDITPPVGTAMTGFGPRDHEKGGARGIHDGLEARAVYLRQGETEILIIGFDLCFFSRDEADRYRAAISRRFNIPTNHILLNASHTHTGPKVGRWFYSPRDELYLDELELRILDATEKARSHVEPVTVWAGMTHSKLPLSRRRPNEKTGEIEFRPYKKGVICDALPVTVLKRANGSTLALLFSVSAHPSNIKGDDRAYQISADYPGAARKLLDEKFGQPCSLFLQGSAGSSKCVIVGEAPDEQWAAGKWSDVERGGKMVADEVLGELDRGLAPIIPELRVASIEMYWPLKPLPSRSELEQVIEHPATNSESMPEVKAMWAREQIRIMDRKFTRLKEIPITAQGISIGPGLRMIALEGEPVAELGNQVCAAYGTGVTYPLGYSNGVQLYLPTTKMLGEGGYEVESYWEYRKSAGFAGGQEELLTVALDRLKAAGIQ